MEKTEILTKKKTHRRKAGGKRRKDKNDRSLETTSDQEPIVPEVAASQTDRQLSEDGEPLRKHFKMLHKENHPLLHPHKFTRGGRRLLRPAKVPKAPQNSTQFIIDDHENSAYFIDFDKGFTPPGARDDVGWSPYFQQDFENVYRTTREAETIDWTQEDLVEKISSLEERVKNLEQQLSMCDSNVYMSQLQHRIVCMQDKNRRIKEFRIWCPMHGKKVRMRNPSTETSSEDCSTSSSQSPDEEDEVIQNGESDSSDEEMTEEDVNQEVKDSINTVSSEKPEDVDEEAGRIGERTGSVQSNDEVVNEEP
ncbi:uncharacterized protein LOC130699998 [Daphnia carinata]|uniref:uncharacterized protein LOC130699998 n=1 Tax=Daphnia carinata TaxID=120202 RepID=UPI00257D6D29|nr:uncharacterized protein LOC130699998 [Daphnia carinata]